MQRNISHKGQILNNKVTNNITVHFVNYCYVDCSLKKGNKWLNAREINTHSVVLALLSKIHTAIYNSDNYTLFQYAIYGVELIRKVIKLNTNSSSKRK